MAAFDLIQRYDESLSKVDPAFERFAKEQGLTFTRNEKDSVGRSLRWGKNPAGLIQLFVSNLEKGEWNFWLCCFQDRDGERFWKTDYLVDSQRLESFADDVQVLLEYGLSLVNDWRAHPEVLGFATKLYGHG